MTANSSHHSDASFTQLSTSPPHTSFATSSNVQDEVFLESCNPSDNRLNFVNKDEDIVILDDDDDDDENVNYIDKIDGTGQATVASPHEVIHCLSRSPSPTQKHDSPCTEIPTAAASSLPSEENVFEISDGDDNSDPHIKTTKAKSSSVSCIKKTHQPSNKYSNWSDSSDDDLPDLDLDKPLSERLRLQGNIPPRPLIVPKNMESPATLRKGNALNPSTSVDSTSVYSGGKSISDDVLRMKNDVKNSTKMLGKSQDVQQKKTKAKSCQKENMHKVPSSCNIELYPTQLQEKINHCHTDILLPSEADTPLVVDYSFPPGTFDIVLCIDNREFYGRYVFL